MTGNDGDRKYVGFAGTVLLARFGDCIAVIDFALVSQNLERYYSVTLIVTTKTVGAKSSSVAWFDETCRPVPCTQVFK